MEAITLKLKIAIVHTFFDEAGGGERLALDMYRALRDLGNKTDLFSAHVDKRAWDVLPIHQMRYRVEPPEAYKPPS